MKIIEASQATLFLLVSARSQLDQKSGQQLAGNTEQLERGVSSLRS